MDKVKLINIVKISGTRVEKFEGERNYLDTGNLKFDRIEKLESVNYNEKPSRANQNVEVDDVIFARMKDTVKVLKITDELKNIILSTGYCVLKPNKEKIDPIYLEFFLKSECFNKQKNTLSTGATQVAINNEKIKQISISLYDIEKQKKIADELEKVQSILNIKKRQLEKFDEIVKSRFIEMFGDPLINNKNWVTKSLYDIGEIGRGVSKHRPRNAIKLLGGVYPLIQTGDVANSGLYITEYKATYSKKGLEQSKMWNAGTLCITIAANIAKTGILTFNACFPDSVVGFVANKETNNIFIHYLFGFFQSILEEQAPESAQKNINLKILSELKVIVPPIELQNKFANFVEHIEKLNFKIKKSLTEIEKLQMIGMSKYFD